MAAERLHFLQLPGEIRNRIYKHVFDDISTLRISTAGCLVSPPIASVCQQIHDEMQRSGYLDHALAIRPLVQTIEAKVTDGRCRHVVQFLKMVAEDAFAKVDDMKVQLKLTGAEMDEKQVRDWVDCIKPDTSVIRPWYAKPISAIDIGNCTRKPVKILYEIDTPHRFPGCPCLKFAIQVEILADFFSFRSYEDYALLKLSLTSRISHDDM